MIFQTNEGDNHTHVDVDRVYELYSDKENNLFRYNIYTGETSLFYTSRMHWVKIKEEEII